MVKNRADEARSTKPLRIDELKLINGIPEITTPISPGELHIDELVVITTGDHAPRQFITQGQPFSVLVTLNLTDRMVSSDTPLSYRVSVYSRSLNGHPRQTIGEASGIITTTDRNTVNVQGRTLAKGIHRIEAEATVQPVDTELMPEQGLTAKVQGNLLVFS